MHNHTTGSVISKIAPLSYVDCDKYWTIDIVMHYTSLMTQRGIKAQVEHSRLTASFAMVVGPEIYDTRLSMGARLFKIGLSFRCANNFARNFVSYEVLAEDFDVDVSTVKRWAKELKDHGILRCVQTDNGLTLKIVRAPEDTYGETFVYTFRKLFSQAHRNLTHLQCKHLIGYSEHNVDVDASTLEPSDNCSPHPDDEYPINSAVAKMPPPSLKNATGGSGKNEPHPSGKNAPLNRSIEVDEIEVEEMKYMNASEARSSSQFDEDVSNDLFRSSSLKDKKLNKYSNKLTTNSTLVSESNSNILPTKKTSAKPFRKVLPDDPSDDERLSAYREATGEIPQRVAKHALEQHRKAVERSYGLGAAERREAVSALRESQQSSAGVGKTEEWWHNAMHSSFPEIPRVKWTAARKKQANVLLDAYGFDTTTKLIDYVFANWSVLGLKYKWQQPGRVPDFGFLLRNHEKLIADVISQRPKQVVVADDDGLF